MCGWKNKAFCPSEDMNSISYLKASGLLSSHHKRALITDLSSAVMVLFVCFVFCLLLGRLKWKRSGTLRNQGRGGRN